MNINDIIEFIINFFSETISLITYIVIHSVLVTYFWLKRNLFTSLQVIIVVVFLLVAVAYFTLAERKFLATVQRRRGPNVVGIYGLLQPLSDGLKLLTKEQIHPASSPYKIFMFSPMLSFALSFIAYSMVPFAKYSAMVEINVGVIFLLTTSSFSVIAIILAGWSSNSKYGFLGALRSTAQMISYELSMGVCVLTIALMTGSFDLCFIVNIQDELWFIVTYLPLSLLFLGALIAETNRHPFDLPEAEAELVAGFNTEYSGMIFALFSLAEYANMFMMGCLHTVLFLGGWYPPCALLNFIPGSFWFSIKVTLFVWAFSWLRAGLPRYRYDHLMALGWKIFLPVSIAYFIFTFCFLAYIDMLPF